MLFLNSGKDVLILSIGALADALFFTELRDIALRHGTRIIVPSGAIGGLDAIESANLGMLREVVIRNIKPPEALDGAPFVVKNRIDLKSISKATQIFEGFADEAAREFSKNMNVTVVLGLAGIGPERTRVIIFVDPKETRNIHEIFARGDFGEGTFTVAGLPSPDNPKTSSQLLRALKPYPKARAYIENLVKPVTTFLRWWLHKGEALSLTTNAIESHFSQICNRIKRIGRRWSDQGLLNWLTVCFYKIFKPELWRLQWLNIPRKISKIRLRWVEATYQWSEAIT